MKKRKLWIILGILLTLLIIFLLTRSKKSTETHIYTKVEKGEFEIVVSVTGELEAMNKENIMAPTELRNEYIRLYQVKIQDLIPEGSMVDSGEYVATLDKTEITTRLRDAQDDLEKQQANFENIKLDTSMTLRNERSNIVDLQYSVEESRLTLDQSKYEPPATQRQAQINLDKAQRSLDNARKNYKIKVKQAQTRIKQAEMDLQRPIRRIEKIQEVMEQFVIRAPKKGMLIYAKEWRGDKRKVGSAISPWDPTVATLPDLSVMISRTYVSEVDINRIKTGQKVRLGVDAFPDRKYVGEVTSVSNVGEQLPNSDTKVFEVIVKIFGSDPVLRPYMTTSNQIIIKQYKDTTYIPLEAIHSQDSIPFVYTKDGTKQIILLGEMNDNQVIVEKGLKKGDEVYLSIPEKVEKMKLVGQELIPQIKARVKEKKKQKEEEERQHQIEENAKRKLEHSNETPSPNAATRGENRRSGQGPRASRR
jgi:multidrug efflux pump subunit AcrA (membrane-fusion protein)